jgi:hypothetical protein
VYAKYVSYPERYMSSSTYINKKCLGVSVIVYFVVVTQKRQRCSTYGNNIYRSHSIIRRHTHGASLHSSLPLLCMYKLLHVVCMQCTFTCCVTCTTIHVSFLCNRLIPRCTSHNNKNVNTINISKTANVHPQ